MAREKAHIRVKGLQPVQMLAGFVGLVFLVAGVIGFTRTGFADFAGHEPVFVSVFAINPLHNLVNVVLGLIGVLMSVGSGLARIYGWLLLIATGIMFVWGMMITGVFASNPVPGAGNPLNLNSADNWLHLGTAVLGLLIAVIPARKVALVERDDVIANDTTAHYGHSSDDSDRRIQDDQAREDNMRTNEIPVAEPSASSSKTGGGWKHGWRRHPAG